MEVYSGGVTGPDEQVESEAATAFGRLMGNTSPNLRPTVLSHRHSAVVCVAVVFLSRFHFPILLRSTVITRFIATMRTLTPDRLLHAPGQVSLVHELCASRHSVSNYPMRPGRGNALTPLRLGHRLALAATGSASDFVH